MALDTVRFLGILLAALALVPAAAHLMELPNKTQLSGADYLVVQQLYRGWAFAGIVVIGALLSTLLLAFMVRSQPRAFVLTVVAVLCIVGTQVTFWMFTYPVNRETMNWTMLLANWAELRARWEYSHAASAVLNLIALVALILSVLVKEET